MKLKLLAPASSLNWMLVAENLVDPSDWSQFLLNHGPETERFHLEQAIKQASSEKVVTVTPYRLLWARGMAGFEYLWQAEVAAIEAHAHRVAELLSMELEIPEVTSTTRKAG